MVRRERGVDQVAAANANACMTRWKFETWNDTGCFQNEDGSTDCAENMPMWHATVSFSRGALGFTRHPSNVGIRTVHIDHITDRLAVPPLANRVVVGASDAEFR